MIEDYWKKFEQTGKVEDYLKYMQAKQKGAESHAAIHQGIDYQRTEYR